LQAEVCGGSPPRLGIPTSAPHLDGTGADGVDADVVLGQVKRAVASKLRNGAFGGGIRRAVRLGFVAADAALEHDAAAARRL
jgi:hypothetical protein